MLTKQNKVKVSTLVCISFIFRSSDVSSLPQVPQSSCSFLYFVLPVNMTFYNEKWGFLYKLAVLERLLWQLGRASVAVADVERWPLQRGGC